MVQKIFFEQPQSAVERDSTTHKIGLGKPRTALLYLEFNNPNKRIIRAKALERIWDKTDLSVQ